jgi:hypothetical protein
MSEPVLTELVSLVEELDELEAPFELPVVVLVGGQKMSGYLVSARAWHSEVERLTEGKSRALAEERRGRRPDPKHTQHEALQGWKAAPHTESAFLHMRVGSETWRLALTDVTGWSPRTNSPADGS